MGKLPIDEKIKLTSGQGNWHLFESALLEGRSINVADGPHGVRVYGKAVDAGNFLNQSNLMPATLFPSASAMASTWNKELIENVGKIIGRECRYYQIDVLLGPGINLKRSPLGGRNFEYYSEDPYLTSTIAEAFVKGVQSEHVGACIKHFGLNEQETMRRFVDVKVDERTMHEMYLYPFYKVIKNAQPWMVMSSYNRLNGVYASESSYLLKDILRKRWGYQGVVVSDWGAVQDKVKSLKNGMNIDMPGPSAFESKVKDALQQGTLTERELDESLKPVFDLHKRIQTTQKLKDINFEKHHQRAKSVAEEAIVLLENDGVLPIKNHQTKLGIVGDFAKHPRINGGGSATVRPYKQEIPYDAFKEVFDNIDYAQAYQEEETTDALIAEAVDVAKASDIVLFFTGTTKATETEGQDRPHMMLPVSHLNVFNAMRKINKNIVVILSNGSALDLRSVRPHSRAILETWFLGGAAGKAIVDVVIGAVNPSGRLQETFPYMVEHTPHYPTFPSLETVDYSQDLIMNGYRFYDTHRYEVLYPFGYGLSYATIDYSDIRFVNASDNQSIISVEVTLENHSDIDAYETVQLYVGKNIEYLIKPEKELKAFEKVFVRAKSKAIVTIKVEREAFETYDTRRQQFVVYNGCYTIHVGRHSRAIYATHSVDITDKVTFHPAITFDYPIKFLKLYYPHWYEYIETHYRPLRWHEQEAPIWRILNSYQRHKGIDDVILKQLMKDIKADLDASNK